MNDEFQTARAVLTPGTLVIGSGRCAVRVAEMLAEEGIEVILASPRERFSGPPGPRAPDPPDTGFEWLAPARLVACHGFVGEFDAVLETGGSLVQRQVAAIVIAEDARRRVNFDAYGLNRTAGVRSLSEFKQHTEEHRHRASEDFAGKTVAYLNGLAGESTPVIFEEILRHALALQALPDVRTAVLTGNLKVAGNGLEALYREAKDAGTLFFKFTDNLPEIRQLTDGRADMTFEDETTGYSHVLRPDVTVVDESMLPSDYTVRLGRLLELHSDAQGFLQTENVHRYTVATNRRGIWVCGASRGPLGPADITADAAEVVAAVRDLIRSGSEPLTAKARIDTGQCIKCLTCYRLCPHRSIRKGLKMIVAADACEGCGICAAECPRGAIELGDRSGPVPINMPRDVSGSLVAFCCSRSAARAGELAECGRFTLPARLQVVEIPCAGALSVGQMLAPLADGAGGVLVLTCHDGNCHSETGNDLARRRVDLLSSHLPAMGTVAGRLEIQTLAANMAPEFAEIVRRFDEKLSAMKA
jgi:coenzyme F420-reducing hydrogenase delta subunit/Pyruvate/2-oxoacid:ferredoxin oxidoreductase delta subunit